MNTAAMPSALIGSVSRTGCGSRPAREHQHAHEQVRQQRIDERDADVDPRRLEERVGDREREQHQQVEVQQPPRRPRERQHEQHAQRQPDPQRVGDPPERAGVAARHRPLDLVARPALEHAAAAVVDDGLRDLLAPPVPLGRGEERHLPAVLGAALVVDAAVGQLVLRPRPPHLGPRGDRAQHVGRRHPPARRGRRRSRRARRASGREAGAAASAKSAATATVRRRSARAPSAGCRAATTGPSRPRCRAPCRTTAACPASRWRARSRASRRRRGGRRPSR